MTQPQFSCAKIQIFRINVKNFSYGLVLAVVSSADSVASPPPGSPSSPCGTTAKLNQEFRNWIEQIENNYMSINISYGITASSQLLPNQQATVFENHQKCLIQHFEWTKVYFKNAKNGPFWRVFENLMLAVKQCYQTGQL